MVIDYKLGRKKSQHVSERKMCKQVCTGENWEVKTKGEKKYLCASKKNKSGGESGGAAGE